MTQIQASLTVDQHTELMQDGNYILWPGESLTVTPGDWILAYRGPGPCDAVTGVAMTGGGSYSSAPTVGFSGGGGSGAAGTAVMAGGAVVGVAMTSYGSGYTSNPTVTFTGGVGSGASGIATVGLVIPSTDGSYAICFGGYWNGNYGASSGFGGFASGVFLVGGNTQWFNGPYCSVPPNSVNLHDEMFWDVEHLSESDYVLDPLTQQYPHKAISSPPNVHSGHIISNSVGRTHLVDAHPSQGGFVGGVLAIANAFAHQLLWNLTNSSAAATLDFMALNADGDQSTPGMYHIASALQTTPFPQTGVFVGPEGSSAYAAVFPPAGPAQTQISFCRYFPGAGGNQGQSNSGGSLPDNYTFYVRFCLYRSITRGGYTQTIESPLSTYMAIVTGSFGNAHTIHFDLPKRPTLGGWTGFRVYMHDPTFGEGGQYSLVQTVTGDINNPTTVTIGAWGPWGAGGVLGIYAANGFAAWPSGVDFSNSDNTEPAIFFEKYMTNLAYVAGQPDQATLSWPVYPTQGKSQVNTSDLGAGAVGSTAIGPNAVLPRHVKTNIVVSGTGGPHSVGIAPGTNANSGSIAKAVGQTVGGLSCWSTTAQITSTWSLTTDQYTAIMAAGGNPLFGFTDDTGNYSAWSNVVSNTLSGPSQSVIPLIGAYINFTKYDGSIGGGIVQDVTLNFNSGSPTMVVTWQALNFDFNNAHTVYIWCKALGISS